MSTDKPREKAEIPVVTTIKVDSDQRAFYNQFSDFLIKLSRRYKRINGVEMVAILGRITGVLIAQMAPDARSMAKMIAKENIDKAIESINPKKQEITHAVNDTAKNAG